MNQEYEHQRSPEVSQGLDKAILIDGPIEAKQKSHSAKQRKKNNRRRLQIFFNATLAFTSLMLMLIAGYQVLVYQGQLAVMQNTLNASIAASHLDQRAWLWFDLAFGDVPATERPKAAMAVGQPIQIPFRIRNTGKTPANKMTGSYVIQIAGVDETMVFPVNPFYKPAGVAAYPVYGGDIGYTKIETGEIYPNAFTLSIAHRVGRQGINPAPTPLTRNEASEVSSGAKIIYFAAFVAYVDGFGAQHWTQFCQGIRNPRIIQPALNRRCGEYNRSDDK